MWREEASKKRLIRGRMHGAAVREAARAGTGPHVELGIRPEVTTPPLSADGARQ